MVKIEPAAVRRMGLERRWAAPRYAVTPTSSTRRATLAIVVTSVRTVEKSNLQVSKGLAPRAVRPDYEKQTSGSDQTKGDRNLWTHSKRDRVSSLIILDNHELLDSELRIRESSGDKIAFIELCKSLGIKFGFELF
jgi:hypothetical protein